MYVKGKTSLFSKGSVVNAKKILPFIVAKQLIIRCIYNLCVCGDLEK
jgi:hypothetical protein